MMTLVKARTFNWLVSCVFLIYGLLAILLGVAPTGWQPAWLPPSLFHPTAAWMIALAGIAIWVPIQGSRHIRFLMGLALAGSVLLAPLLIPVLRPASPESSLLYRLLWPDSALGWPSLLVAAWLVAFVTLSLRPGRFVHFVAAIVSYVLIAGAALGLAGNYLKLNLIYNQPWLAPIPLPIALVLLVFGLILLRRRQLLAVSVATGESREDSLISSIGLGLLVTIAFSTGLASFVVLQSQVESSLYQSQLLTMDNRIIIFYHAMDATFSELSPVARNPEVVALVEAIDNKPTQELRDKLVAVTDEKLPLAATAFEFRSSTGTVLAGRGEFLPAQTMWVDYRGTTEIKLNWRKGLPFITMTLRINGADQSKVGEVTIEQRVQDWEQLVTDSYDLGSSGTMIVCGQQGDTTSCLDSRHKTQLFTPAANDALTPLILNSFEGERSPSRAPHVTYDEHKKPWIVTYGSIGRVRLATQAAGIYLGMLIAVDAEEFYEPVRLQLKEILPLLIGIILAGAIVLRRLVLPLIRALRDKEERFRELTELSSDCYWQMGASLQFVEVTGVDLHKSGINVSEWLGRTIAQLPASFDNDSVISELARKLVAKETFYDVTLRLPGADSTEVHFVSLSGAPLYDEDEKFVGYRGVGKNITLRKLAEEALRESQQSLERRVEQRTAELSVEVQERSQAEARFRSLVELSSDWYWEVDTANRFVQLSGEVERKGGFSAANSLGKAFWEQPWVIQGENDWDSLRILLGTKESFYEYTLKINDFEGQVRYLAISGQPIFDLNQTFMGYRGTGKDVTEKRIAEERIHFLAHFDSLTKLPNRALLYEQVRGAIERAKRYKYKLALLFIDLDRFKIINDTLGHDAGDEVLRTVAHRLKECVRDCDMVSRLGGDEFVILLENLSLPDQASMTGQRVLDLINQPIMLMGETHHIGASIGISLFPDDGDSIAELLRQSDAAMYKAKSEGRNGIFFFSDCLTD